MINFLAASALQSANNFNSAGLRININKDESVHIWNAGGKEVVRDNYKALVLDSKDPIFYVTIGSEKFRSEYFI
jgi:hypothetical protein